MKLRSPAPLALLAGLSFAGAPAPTGDKSEAAVRAEIEFARGLASEWGMADWAELALEKIEKEGVDAKLRPALELARCEIAAEGARAERDPAKRDAQFARALAAYRTTLARAGASSLRAPIAASWAETCASHARSLALRIESAPAEEARAVRAQLQRDLGTAAEETGVIAEQLAAIKDPTAEQESSLLRLLAARGAFLFELARATGDTPTFAAAERAFERLAEIAGDGTPQCLRAFVGLGDTLAAQYRWKDAVDYYRAVVEYAVTTDDAAWTAAAKEMTGDEKARRFAFLELGTPGLVAALESQGRVAEACEAGLHFYDTWKRERLELGAPAGDLAALALARVLVDAEGFVGGNAQIGEAAWFATFEELAAKWPNKKQQRAAGDFALELAREIAHRNPGTAVQARAQRLLAEIVSRSGADADPELAFEAAQADFDEGDFAAAVRAMKQVLGVLATRPGAAARDELASKSLWHIGKSLERQNRPLEAALAYQEGATRYAGVADWAARNADGFYRQIALVKRSSKDDAQVTALWNQAEKLLGELAGGAAQAEIAYRQADRLYQEKQYAEAREAYAKVPADGESYELALVYRGVCDFQLADLDAADATFAQYLDVYVADPRHAAADARLLARRKQASAVAAMYRGLCAYERAKDGKGEWKRVVELLGGFHDAYPEQDAFVPLAMYRTLTAYLQLGDMQGVERMYALMLARAPESRWTGNASVEVYKELQKRYDAAKDSDPKLALATLRQMAEYLAVGNRNAEKPGFNNLRQESKHWLELGEWARAQIPLEALRERFAESERENVEKFVLPDLARALMNQMQVDEAARVLAPLVDAKRASRETARLYARCLAGWCEFRGDDLRPAQMVGVGGAANFETAARILAQIVAGETKFEPAWYDAQYDLIWAYLQWGKLDGRKLDAAKSQLATLSADLGERFDEIHDAALRRKYQWLKGEIR